jgi:hypothetical protein
VRRALKMKTEYLNSKLKSEFGLSDYQIERIEKFRSAASEIERNRKKNASTKNYVVLLDMMLEDPLFICFLLVNINETLQEFSKGKYGRVSEMKVNTYSEMMVAIRDYCYNELLVAKV